MPDCQGCGRELVAVNGHKPRKWCSEICRRGQYQGTCDTCGGPTDGSNGRAQAPTRCHLCSVVWTRPAILEAIQEWAHQHDGQPPKSIDWCAPVPEGWPSAQTVAHRFGTFNQGVEAAGLVPYWQRERLPGPHDLASMIRNGRTVHEIAVAYNVVDNAVALRLRSHGMPVSSLHEDPRVTHARERREKVVDYLGKSWCSTAALIDEFGPAVRRDLRRLRDDGLIISDRHDGTHRTWWSVAAAHHDMVLARLPATTPELTAEFGPNVRYVLDQLEGQGRATKTRSRKRAYVWQAVAPEGGAP